MINWVIVLASACGIAVVQGLFLGTTLMLRKDQRSTEFFLGLAILGLAVRIGKSLVFYFWLDMSLWGVALGGAGLWIIGPALLLYVQRLGSLRSKNKLKYIHLTPSMVLIMSGGFLTWSNMTAVYGLGSVQLLIYLIICVILVVKSNLSNKNYVLAILLGIGMIALTFIFQFIQDSIQYYAIGAIVASIILYTLSFAVIRGFRKTKSSSGDIKKEVLDEVLLLVKVLFNEEEFYKVPKLTLSKLAQKIERPSYLVRMAIVQLEGKNFNDFVNSYRIKEVRKLLENDYPKYTIEGIAYDVGFTSISSFYEAFKKTMNCTPAEYKKNLDIVRLSTQ